MSNDVDLAAEPDDRHRYSPDQRKAMILDAARGVLFKNPNATLEEIAEAAGVTRQLVSRYFPGGGVTPIAEALFDDYEHHFAGLFVELPAEGPKDAEEMHEAISKVIKRFLDWAQADGQPWLFGGEGAAMSSHLAARRADLRVNLAMVMLHFARRLVKETEATRVAVQAEGRAVDEVLWLLLTGQLERKAAEEILNARFVSLFQQTLPALGG